MKHRVITKITILSVLGLISLGLLSKKRTSLDYVIHQDTCQALSANADKIELKPRAATTIVCEESQKYYHCSHYDQDFNQITEARKYYKDHQFDNKIHLSLRDNTEKIMIDFRTKYVTSSHLEQSRSISSVICTGVIYGKEQLRERFPELIAGSR